MENNNKLTHKKELILLIIIAAVTVIALCVILVVRNRPGEFSFMSAFKTVLISMVPIVELRGAIPIAVGSYKMSLAAAFILAYLGNISIIIPVILLTRTVFDWLKKHIKFLARIVEKYEKKLLLKSETVRKYEILGLLFFVAIPIPGTGAWTGAMIAGLLDMRVKTAAPVITVGVLVAGLLILTLTDVCGMIL